MVGGDWGGLLGTITNCGVDAAIGFAGVVGVDYHVRACMW